MDQAAVNELILATLAGYRYEPPSPGSTIGVPWSAEKVYAHVEALKQRLVSPYLQRFELRETYAQSTAAAPTFADYWVVAESGQSHLPAMNPQELLPCPLPLDK
jgi:hypothetical protein